MFTECAPHEHTWSRFAQQTLEVSQGNATLLAAFAPTHFACSFHVNATHRQAHRRGRWRFSRAVASLALHQDVHHQRGRVRHRGDYIRRLPTVRPSSRSRFGRGVSRARRSPNARLASDPTTLRPQPPGRLACAKASRADAVGRAGCTPATRAQLSTAVHDCNRQVLVVRSEKPPSRKDRNGPLEDRT